MSSEDTLLPGEDGSLPATTPSVDAHAALEQPGQQVGPYKLVRPLGEGGFGNVWLAERREPFVQQVALKIVKAGMDSKAVLARFDQERQALAVMNHPNVARVFDGGLTPHGRPYFAMEYVRGESITEFCDRHRLRLKDRLRLFVHACAAIEHAHSKGIIHRDLKPSNIIAFMDKGDEPSAKVIDFGIAKAMTTRMTGQTVFTEAGQMIGTPEYMSPEQADPGEMDVDVRSDVYSLGVVLYELIVGSPPFDAKTLRSRAYHEVQRMIREVEAPAPSTRFTAMLAEDAVRAASIAAARRDTAGPFARAIRAELEWIPLKALRKDRTERYATAADLAADVQRYIRGEVLVAGPVTLKYRIGKWIARRELTTAWALVALSILLTPVGEFPVGATPEEWSLTYSEISARMIPGVLLSLLPTVLSFAGLFGLWARLILKDQCSALARVSVGGIWVLGAITMFAPFVYAVDHVPHGTAEDEAPILGFAACCVAVLFLVTTIASPLIIAWAISAGRLRTYAVAALTFGSVLLSDWTISTYRDFWFAQHARTERSDQLRLERESAQQPDQLPPPNDGQ